jgi:probable rRNA maturation factor
VNVFFSDEQGHPADGESLRAFATQVLAAEGYPADTEVAVYLVDAMEMTTYNERFMDRKGPTDVLAFPTEELVPGDPPRPVPGEPPLNIGDVFLCPVEVARRAAEENTPYDDFLHLLLVHGMLHLLGYEHEDDAAAELMERREDELLGLIGRSWE